MIANAKYYLYKKCGSESCIFIGKEFDDIKNNDKWSKSLIGVFVLCDTQYGDILLYIDTAYDGSLISGMKFMHIISFLKFHSYSKIHCYDESSYRYITKITESFVHEGYDWEIVKKF